MVWLLKCDVLEVWLCFLFEFLCLLVIMGKLMFCWFVRVDNKDDIIIGLWIGVSDLFVVVNV